MIGIFSSNCFAQVSKGLIESFASAIGYKGEVYYCLVDITWSTETVKNEVKDELLSILKANGYKARYGFIFSETAGACKIDFGTYPVDIFSIKNPDGKSYIAIFENKDPRSLSIRYCDLKVDWEKTYQEVYGTTFNK